MRPIQLGFQTVGNATLICYDRGPVLATDPWLDGDACFGSWALTHEVPAAQREAIARCPFVWISQALPDHLHLESLGGLTEATVLLPDHHGGRLKAGLEELGRTVRVLPDGEWVRLSDRLRVMSLADVLQDAVLLVELGDRLLVNANDAVDRGVGGFLQKVVQEYRNTYLLSSAGVTADLVRVRDEDGNELPPPARRKPLGEDLGGLMGQLDVRYFIPSGWFYRHQRPDAEWANAHLPGPDAHFQGFHGKGRHALPPFVHWNFETGGVSVLDPPERPTARLEPEQCGDDWSQALSHEERDEIAAYFAAFDHLRTFLGSLSVIVGGREHRVWEGGSDHERRLALEAPRGSLLAAAREHRFEELLRSGFAILRTGGEWGGRRPCDVLHPDLLPFVSRVGDMGRARSTDEVRTYLADYRGRGWFDVPENPLGIPLLRAFSPYA